jgi:hypothetical protein
MPEIRVRTGVRWDGTPRGWEAFAEIHYEGSATEYCGPKKYANEVAAMAAARELGQSLRKNAIGAGLEITRDNSVPGFGAEEPS